MDILTITSDVSNTIVIEKSKFISIVFPIENKDDAQNILSNLKEKYYDATHICYAYITLDNEVSIFKSSDDGEPSQTAGAPILNVLRKNNLMNVLCVVIRYFGGIKLGAGGLTRAYSNSAAEVVKLANIVTYTDAYKYLLSFSYDKIKEIDILLEKLNIDVTNKEYEMQVNYEIIIYDEDMFVEKFDSLAYLNIYYKKLLKIKALKK